MRTDKLTTRFQTALSDAQSLAVGKDNQFIEAIHVLKALMDQESSTVKQVLSSTGVNVAEVNAKLNEAIVRLPQVEGHQGDVQLSNELIRLLNQTDKLAQQRNDQFISSELFLLAMADSKSVASDILKAAGTDKNRLEQAIENVRGGETVDDANAEENRQALEKYTIDLSERAAAGKLDPVIGRDEEIRRTVQVLQ
ncbi:MAG: hypothetical protein DRQ44_15310, partial [Gammaproteobacteria bacterium]